jgi:hypothetical protein
MPGRRGRGWRSYLIPGYQALLAPASPPLELSSLVIIVATITFYGDHRHIDQQLGV